MDTDPRPVSSAIVSFGLDRSGHRSVSPCPDQRTSALCSCRPPPPHSPIRPHGALPEPSGSVYIAVPQSGVSPSVTIPACRCPTWLLNLLVDAESIDPRGRRVSHCHLTSDTCRAVNVGEGGCQRTPNRGCSVDSVTVPASSTLATLTCYVHLVRLLIGCRWPPPSRCIRCPCPRPSGLSKLGDALKVSSPALMVECRNLPRRPPTKSGPRPVFASSSSVAMCRSPGGWS